MSETSILTDVNTVTGVEVLHCEGQTAVFNFKIAGRDAVALAIPHEALPGLASVIQQTDRALRRIRRSEARG
ncbi:MAG: hypothetical protein KA105_09845 [Caulobacter sp.]|nr:hypothetical protein [Caulobacter sp.]